MGRDAVNVRLGTGILKAPAAPDAQAGINKIPILGVGKSLPFSICRVKAALQHQPRKENHSGGQENDP